MASSHLEKLVEGDLLVVEMSGRHHYYRLAGPKVAYALEVLNSIARQKSIQSLKEYDQSKVLRYVCTCYHCIVGEVGVGLTDKK
ncbi:ArsR/SmtB family transcription factor [Brevibacillus laterosporus]|nr:helix-turn-helix transcriptional regulator [Brevibacillus laterosporus]MCR8978379.1 ArsR family transcriptional regulator [Brevibacillus laterosporus]MCZ0805535.1 helix-turn-helix transcriptional regulator [Brevibacillus laterosporus]MCZ0825257.1 helix-turn-helix transcriptional regulator [Brevibacillus laterosporus]MCZ0849033.1 helix-turn-helix transcriptional regulator [Brevibacillus laterosporus]MED1663401.1 helix-turn-helix transcriptional regulator [Brevibacillus laterosporus]